MKIENSDGSSVEIPNWLVVVLAVLLVALLVPVVAIVVPVLFGGSSRTHGRPTVESCSC